MKALELRVKPEASARVVALHYVSASEEGYTRKRKGKGFIYLNSQAKLVKDKSLTRRFDSLAIPPNYNEVWICKDEHGHIQATALDAKGRKQYIYHPRWREVRDEDW